jgi:hypothetical protein
VIRYSGTAAELKTSPELLRSAYLLRGSTASADTVAAAHEQATEATAEAEAAE